MSSFGGSATDQEDVEAQLKSLGELQRLLLQGVDPATLNLVLDNDGDFTIDTLGNLIRWA